MAIIAFWFLDNKTWRCKHFFFVPNPLKREISSSGTNKSFQILFTGQNKELFFFYKPEESTNDSEYNLGILKLKSEPGIIVDQKAMSMEI